MQLDRAERGFSFQADGPLDMRMSKSGLTAAEFLNSADEAEIARVLRDYGEEPRARAIARAIVAARPVERTAELAAIVRRAAGFRPGQKSDPATRTFQAIRIHLNAELDELEQGLAAAERSLRPGGRLGRRHLSQPRGPDREALLPRTQRRNAGRFAPPSCACVDPQRADVRAGRQAGFPDGARAGREPARALGAAAERGPHVRASMEGEACNERPQLPFACSWSRAAPERRSAATSSRCASRRSAPRWRMSRPRSCSPSATSALLQTEIGTRGRLPQLERWNVKVLALSAPVGRPVPRAAASSWRGSPSPSTRSTSRRRWCWPRRPRLRRRPPRSASRRRTNAGAPQPASPRALLHQASLKNPRRARSRRSRSPHCPRRPVQVHGQAGHSGEAGTNPSAKLPKAVDKPGLAAAHRPRNRWISRDGAAKPVTKPVRLAKDRPARSASGEALSKPKRPRTCIPPDERTVARSRRATARAAPTRRPAPPDSRRDAPAADVRHAGLCRRRSRSSRCASSISRRSATMPGARKALTALVPERGDIVDRDGEPLARTIDAWTIAHPPDQGHRRQARARPRSSPS